MVDRPPVARSPIATGTPESPETVVDGWAVNARSSTAALTLSDHTPLTKVAVKALWDGALAETLGVRLGRTARASWHVQGAAAQVLLAGAAPGEWLALAAPRDQAIVVAWLADAAARTEELVSVVDVTHGRALLRLTGAKAPALLAKECSLDLQDAVCPDASALRSSVAGVATDILRDDRSRTRSYLLHCERSLGQYLFDSLLDAGREFGVEADGFRNPGI